MPELVSHILHSLNRKLGKKIRGVSQKGLKKLMAYSWPGNVRELQNILEREAILSQTDILHIHAMPTNHLQTQTAASPLQTLAEAEAQHIEQTLKLLNWRISGTNGAARVLGVPPSTLRSRMKKLGITRQITNDE
jgi:DNA-binding NtrC family response regulator